MKVVQYDPFATWEDPWGQKHRAKQITATKYLEETEETWSWLEGYTNKWIEEHIFISQEGERFRQKRNVIDPWGGSVFIDENERFWTPVRGLAGKIIDRDGNPVTRDSLLV